MKPIAHTSPLPRRSFLKQLGTAAFAAPFITSGLRAASPNETVRHASFGASGMVAFSLPCPSRVHQIESTSVQKGGKPPRPNRGQPVDSHSQPPDLAETTGLPGPQNSEFEKWALFSGSLGAIQ